MRFSVVVPVYNAAFVLDKTVPSMRLQEEPAQWLFVDDGSTDGTAEILDRLVAEAWSANTSARVLRHEVNRGRAAARNTAIREADGDILCFLDCDVAPRPGYLTALKQALAQPDAVAAVGKLEIAHADPQDPYHRYLTSQRRGVQGHKPGRPLAWRHFLLGLAAVGRKAVDAIGLLDEQISYGEDLDYACRLAQHYPDGLRWAPGAVASLHDLGTLDTALAKMAEFGKYNLPRMVERYPEVAHWTGVEVVHSPPRGPALRRLLAPVMLRPRLAGTVRRMVDRLPPGLSDYAVRYLLGYTLAKSYREGTSAS